ncbi:hypothetical protein OIU78_030359 [Salix suchowensis]|nr:hypothetical protein OIU78_030359 [Salix suchowensis]
MVDEMGDPKSDDWLPEGWRVEVKVRNNGKKDKVIGNCLILFFSSRFGLSVLFFAVLHM